MTDKQIGQAVLDIIGRGKKAEVYKNKDGIVILEVVKKVIKTYKE